MKPNRIAEILRAMAATRSAEAETLRQLAGMFDNPEELNWFARQQRQEASPIEMTVEQYAAEKNISAQTVRRQIKAGKLRAVTYGRRTVRIPQETGQ